VLPATIDTPHFQQAANYTGRKVVAMPPVYSPERVARAVVALVRHPRREVVVGPAGRALVRQSRMAPAVAERAMARQTDKSHLSRDEEAPATHGALHVPAPGKGAVHGGWGGRRRIAMRRTAVAAALAGAAGHRGPPDDPRSDGGLTAAIGCHAARGRSLREREPARRRQPCRPVRHLTRQGRYAVWVDCHPGC
jgi:hypothetical protein